MRPPSLDDQRAALRSAPCEAPVRYRILLVRGGRHPGAPHDQAVLDALHCLGHTVFDLDVGRHPAVLAGPAADGPPAGGPAPAAARRRFHHEPVTAVVDRFAPHVVLLAGDGLVPDKATARFLREAGIATACLHDGPGAAESADLALRPAPALARADLLQDPLPSPGEFARVLGAGPSPDPLRDEVLAHRSASALPADVARRAFRRVAEAHLYEHRVEAVLAALRGRRPDALPDPRAGGAPRPRTVLFSGYYGAGNRGDDLLLESLLAHLEAALPDVHPVVAAADAGEVERTHGVQAFRRADPTAAEDHARRATAMVLGPGGHWHDYSIRRAGGAAGMVRGARVSPAHMAQLPLLVSAYGGAVHVYGMGVGPLADPAARAAVHLTGRLARSVSVRDPESLDVLQPLPASWPAEVVVAPDAVYGLALPAPRRPAPRRPPYLAVNLRPWLDDAAGRRRLVDALVDGARRRGLAIVAVPMQATDVPVLEELAAWAPEDVDVEVLPPGLPLDEFLDVLRHAEALVSMRLHANLLMHRLRRPALGLAYDPKVRSHFVQLGRPDAVCALADPPEQVLAALERRLDETGLPPETLERLDALELEASRQLDRLIGALAAEPRRDPDPGWVRHLPPAAAPRPAPAPDPWWPAAESVDPGRAVLTSGSTVDAARRVEATRRTSAAGDEIALASGGPRRGDYVEWTLPVDTAPGEGLRMELSLRGECVEGSRPAGELVYTLSVGGRALFTHDVTAWNERQSVWVALRAASATTSLGLRLEALRDCGDGGRGPAATLAVERVRVVPWEARGELAWGSSSPYAVPADGADGTSAPGPASPRPSAPGGAPARTPTRRALRRILRWARRVVR
ncbi:hypothetical protein E7744_09400 [Citricoccus sp. SGAir0253]|uniref:polysaccharide pyruvyl transferase family protein n=1 Tax=Citricoccus sp. SGAir0253 TaxID=2567881 RepID=UPI0010CCDBD7|nr:polysaccharide pyruvyl transferase family protein [Citricoccus sp. SGAir0253]QCU78356.1 hypothetical protein E7744_09400 [Citricoccus sp. SGAir0253]